jgi:V/A-type H+-transporting ATPase subunit G/H
VDIKELQELIERERIAEEKVRKAKEEAQAILKNAREKAESILQAVDSDQNWEMVRQAKKEEIARKKAEVEEEHKQKISLVDKTAREKFERAVAYVTKRTLRVEI